MAAGHQTVSTRRRPRRILAINPNTSTAITKTFQPILSELDLPNTTITYWTSPAGPSMIKNYEDLCQSASQCLPWLLDIADNFDGFLAACYADHPLVHLLRGCVGSKPVVGIFDASIFAAVQLLDRQSTFGIVTTAVAYETLLDEGVQLLLGSNEQLSQFSGTCASDVCLEDLQPEGLEMAEHKVMEATSRLIKLSGGALDVVSMGGVILAGMEKWVHQACELEMGVKRGKKVKVVDQLLAGMLTLDALLEQIPLHTVDYRQALR